MEDSLGIQPCCIDKKLPPLIEAGGVCSFFFSNGDWGLKKLWEAVTCMVPEKRFIEDNKCVGSDNFTLITLDTVDEYVLRYIRDYMNRYWIQALCLVIADSGKEAMVRTELDGLLDRVWYLEGRREAVDSNIWIRSSSEKTLVITGPIHHGDGNKKFCQYTASLSNDNSRAKQAFISYRGILRLKAAIKGNDNLFGCWLMAKVK